MEGRGTPVGTICACTAEQERLNRLEDLKDLEAILAKIKEEDERDLKLKVRFRLCLRTCQ